MYAQHQQQLGDLGLPPGASTVASTFVSAATNYAVASIAAGALAPIALGSMAGPIGTIVGAIVSIFMAIFGGGKVKSPIFGLIAIIPDADNNVVRVGRMLELLSKPMHNLGWAWGVPQKQRDILGPQHMALIDANPPGVLAITSGGTPTAHESVVSSDFAKIQQRTMELAKPFNDTLALITDPTIKESILNYALPYKQSSSYYFQIDPGPGKEAPTTSKVIYYQMGLSQRYDAVKISGGGGLGSSLSAAFKSIPENMNTAFINFAGINVMTGTVIDTAKANQAFAQPSVTSSISGIVSSPIGLLALIGGYLVLSR